MARWLSALSTRDPASIAALVALTMLVVTLMAGLLVPIYTDEIAWRMMLARSSLDGGFDRGLGDQCGAGTVVMAPLFMQPMRHLSAWVALHVADPRAVRISGVGLALLWVAMFWRLGRFLHQALRAPARAIGLSLLGLGVIPFLLVWSRPEQPLLIAYTGCLLIALSAQQRPAPTRPKHAWAAASGIAALGLVTLGYHPKAVVFLPITLFAAALSSRGREGQAARVAAIGLLVLCGLVASQYWTTRLSCPGNPGLAAKLAHENVASAIGARTAFGAVDLLVRSALPWRYIKMATPPADYAYMSGWLPTLPVQPGIGAVWRFLSRTPWYAAIILTLFLSVCGALTALVRRAIDPRLALALTVVATVTAWSATQINKNSYESSLQLPLAAIALLLALSNLPQRLRPAVTACALPLAAIAMFSQILLLGNYATALAATAARPGPIDAQPFSYVPWGYPELRREILAAARACALDPVRSRKLLVDDMTYFPLIQSREPLNRMAYFGPWHGTIGDPITYLRTHGSSGAVVACAYLPPEVRAQAKAVGRFCCLGPWAGAAR